MCQNKGNNQGNKSGNQGNSRPVFESGRGNSGNYKHSTNNDGAGRITTTGQGTGGNPPKQGK